MAESDKINAMISSLGMDDQNIPEVKINQATGGDYAKEQLKANLGQLYNSVTGDVFDSIDVQILHIQPNQTYWGRTEITDDPPICASLDGETSIDGQTCETCPHYRKRASIDKEERRKECQKGFVLLCMDEHGMPLIIRLNGISANAGRDLAYQAYWNKPLKANPGGYFFRVISNKKKTAAGEAYEFKIILVKDKFPLPEAVAEYQSVTADLLTGPRKVTQIPQEPETSTEPKSAIEDIKF